MSNVATVTDNSPDLSQLAISGGSYCQGSGGQMIYVHSEWNNGFADFEGTTQFRIYRDGTYITGFQASTAGANSQMSFGPYAVTSSSSDTYTLTVQKSGCSEVTLPESTTITETAMARIAIDVVENQTLCPGEDFIIHTNSSSAKLYAASSGGSELGSADANGTITSNLAVGTYWVGLPAGTCVSTTREQVQINGYGTVGTPAITSGVNSRCQGDGTTDFNVSASNATGYNWSINPVTAGTIDGNGIVTWNGSFAGTATLTVVAQDICGRTRSSDHPVTVIQIPAVDAGEDMITFVNSTVNLSGQSPYGGNWSGSGVTGSAFSHGSIGTYSVTYTYTDITTGCSNNDSRQVTVEEVPTITVLGLAEVGLGEHTTLSVPDGYSYQWQRNGVNINGANSSTYEVTRSGSYTVILTNIYGAVATTAPQQINSIPGSDENYVMTWSFKEAGMDPDNFPKDVEQVNRSITYFDGLGRPMQNVEWQGSRNKQDVVQPIVYDEFGRRSESYLPYVSGSNAVYKSDFLRKDDPNYTSSEQYQFYQGTTGVAIDNDPYSQTIYEPSPLNRVVEQGAPGAAWQPDGGATITYDYQINAVSDNVYIWEVSLATDALTTSGYYPAGQLTKNVTTDEESHQVIEFTDKIGQIILKRVQAVEDPDPGNYIKGEWADTYYIYDDFGNLRFVLPPEAVKNIDEYLNNQN